MVTAVNGNTATNKINASSGMLASNFETFLSLLTAQLKNQDPLSPMDSNEFTGQLTQMAGVEQQLLSNQLLTALLNGQKGDGLSSASSFRSSTRRVKSSGRARRQKAARRQGCTTSTGPKVRTAASIR
jgi:flagellar hook assembly protein FlgD